MQTHDLFLECVICDLCACYNYVILSGAVAEWVRESTRWFESHFGKNFSLRNFGNSVYPALPVNVFRMRQ